MDFDHAFNAADFGALIVALSGSAGSSAGGVGPTFIPQLVVPQLLSKAAAMPGGSFPIYGPWVPPVPLKPPPWIPPPAPPPAPPVPPAPPAPLPAPGGPVASVAGEGKHVKHVLMLIRSHPANYAKLVALARMRDFVVR